MSYLENRRIHQVNYTEILNTLTQLNPDELVQQQVRSVVFHRQSHETASKKCNSLSLLMNILEQSIRSNCVMSGTSSIRGLRVNLDRS